MAIRSLGDREREPSHAMNTLTKNPIKNNSKDPNTAFSDRREANLATDAHFIFTSAIRKNSAHMHRRQKKLSQSLALRQCLSILRNSQAGFFASE
ncbi:hypothetical protein [Roseibium sp.]|uniref:hypothetical protein n=1 Tax=Roseibium sp. TaxID=1936156 RepID=UPI003A9881AC